MSFDILGTGSFAPGRIVGNEELSTLVETSDEWIMKRIGVKQRHVCTTESTLDLAVEAAKKALDDAGVNAEELDMIIASSVSQDTSSPGVACMVQNKLGAVCPCFDISAACSGFLFLLDTAAGFFERKTVKKILLVSAERMSGVVDWTDRSTCCIFGDGAGAVVLGEGCGYKASQLNTQGGDDVIQIPVKSNNSPFYKKEFLKPVVHMKGQETYKFAITSMVRDIRAVLEKANLKSEDVALVIPHQANYRIINEARKKLPEIDKYKFCVNIDRYGNTSSASVPILLDEMCKAGKIKRGDYIVLAAFGGGLSSASCVIRW